MMNTFTPIIGFQLRLLSIQTEVVQQNVAEIPISRCKKEHDVPYQQSHTRVQSYQPGFRTSPALLEAPVLFQKCATG
jgi:hypothetical protein